MGTIEIEVNALDVERMLSLAEDSFSEPRVMHWMNTDLHDYFASETISRFSDGIDRNTGVWRKLSDATEHLREQQGYDPDWPINVRTGELFDYVVNTFRIDTDGQDLTFVTPDDERVDATTAIKLEHAQFGASDNPIEGFGPTPPRPVIGFDADADAQAILMNFTNHIVDFLRGAA